MQAVTNQNFQTTRVAETISRKLAKYVGLYSERLLADPTNAIPLRADVEPMVESFLTDNPIPTIKRDEVTEVATTASPPWTHYWATSPKVSWTSLGKVTLPAPRNRSLGRLPHRR